MDKKTTLLSAIAICGMLFFASCGGTETKKSDYIEEKEDTAKISALESELDSIMDTQEEDTSKTVSDTTNNK